VFKKAAGGQSLLCGSCPLFFGNNEANGVPVPEGPYIKVCGHPLLRANDHLFYLFPVHKAFEDVFPNVRNNSNAAAKGVILQVVTFFAGKPDFPGALQADKAFTDSPQVQVHQGNNFPFFRWQRSYLLLFIYFFSSSSLTR